MDWATRLEIKYERTAPALEKKEESLFYHELQQKHEDLLYQCAANQWTLCIPVTSALPTAKVTRGEIGNKFFYFYFSLSHLLLPFLSIIQRRIS